MEDRFMGNSVRLAAERDVYKILELLVQVDMVHHNGRPDIFKGPTTKYSKEQLLSMLGKELDPIFVCVDENDTVLGHAFCETKQFIGERVLTDIKTLYIDDICVDENARGRHVGKTLYDHVMEHARAHEYYNVTLNVWSCNPTAQAFYEAMGMKPQKIGMEVVL